MDRFIVGVKGRARPLWVNLKSNMDRFIVPLQRPGFRVHNYLKSNMDRFIVAEGVVQIPLNLI